MSEEDIETSDDLEGLKELIKKKISAYINVPLDPISFTQMDKHFSGDSLIVDNFPIKSIESLTIGGSELTSEDYIIDYDASLIYFKKEYAGFLILKYTCCLSESQFNLYIEPMVKDMVDYELDKMSFLRTE